MVSPADIAASLAGDRSRKNVTRLAILMGQKGVDFNAYFEEVGRQRQPVKWYMTWLLTHFVEQNPADGNRIQHLIWDLLQVCTHDGMQRDLWRSLTFVAIDEEISGKVYEAAVNIIASAKRPIAIRVHAMYVAFNIAKPWPELLNELYMVLEGCSNDESTGIRNRAGHLVKDIKKLLRK